jgi:hypothetical protein
MNNPADALTYAAATGALIVFAMMTMRAISRGSRE